MDGSGFDSCFAFAASFASAVIGAAETETEAAEATEATEAADVDADGATDVAATGCAAGAAGGTETGTGMGTDIAPLADRETGTGTDTGTGATAGSGTGILTDGGTECGSNLGFVCAVLHQNHNAPRVKLHWICSLFFEFYVLEIKFTSPNPTMRGRFICKGCSSIFGFGTSFVAGVVVGIF